MVHKVSAIALFAPLIVACAPFAAPPTPTLAPEQTSLVQATCDHVMGLTHSGVYRDLCRESLSQSLARKLEVEALAGSYDDCRHQGLSEGSAAFSTCMLDRQARSPMPVTRTAGLTTASLAYDTNSPENTKGYFDVDNRVHWRREQYSCAQLGLTPGTGAFGQCVADLDASLFPNPN